jgi:RNA polymerase sigma factor (sigma-70 family)
MDAERVLDDVQGAWSMSIRLAGKTAKEVGLLLHLGSLSSWTDSQLVGRFISDRDGKEAAFRALVIRHGPMVLGVCQRVLDDPHAAEDAFQATFLVLVKKARTLRDCDRLTNWLYGVAIRIARKAKVTETRRRVVERDAGLENSRRTGARSDQIDLRMIIDEEISRLPERYRLPFVLCHLEGMQHHEVARRLGCPVGTVESRLSRARERLRTRLVRRGLTSTAGALLAALVPLDSRGAMPPLVEAATRAAMSHQAAFAGIHGRLALGQPGLWLSLKSLAIGRAGLALASLIVGTGAIAFGMGRFPGAEVPPVPAPQEQPQPPVAEAKALNTPTDQVPSPEPARAIAARKPTSALARRMDRIAIDGRLDDWPRDLPKYPIRNRLTNDRSYDPGTELDEDDPDAYFMVGYNRDDGLIYLAGVVRDADNVVGHKDPHDTDAVEIYVDGLGSDRAVEGPSSGEWLKVLQASRMPVLQYVGLPGRGPVYGTGDNRNPSLLYGDIDRTTTNMRYRRSGDVTTYEWAFQAFDRYPDRPTRLDPGKRLGLEVAVVDRDPDRKLSSFTTWGPPPTSFKGFDASQLGELILDPGP